MTEKKVTTRKYKNITDISLLGFGCMRLPIKNQTEIDTAQVQEMVDYAIAHGVNYFDTAWPYHEGKSENVIGEALKKYPRESFYLADKFPTWELGPEDNVGRIFNEQLKKCGVEYFDFYLVHCLTVQNYALCERYGLYEALKKKQAEGKIRHLGFSFHDNTDLLQKIVDEHAWDFAQIQLNYLDWDVMNAKRQYEILTEKNIPVIIMEPVRGGALATLNDASIAIFKEANPDASPASWALRYAASLPQVLTVLSGMSAFEQVKDNVDTFTDFKPLSDKEKEVIQKALVAYRSSGTIPCTGCRYCIDCPKGVNIASVFELYNQYKVTSNALLFTIYYATLKEQEQAHNCISCGFCTKHCPQQLDIPKLLEQVNTEYRKLS